MKSVLFIIATFALLFPLSAQAQDTVPMIKLVPAGPGTPTIVPDSLVYHFPWAEGVVPPETAMKKRMEPVYFLNDTIVSAEIFRALNPELIERVDVLRGPSAELKHAGTSRSGVVMVYLKKPE